MQQLSRLPQGTPVSLHGNRGRPTRLRNGFVLSHCDSTTSGPSTSERTQAQDVAAAWSLLKAFTELDFKGRAHQHLRDATNRSNLRAAFMLAYSQPHPEENWSPGSQGVPEVLLGVLASESRLAVRALRDWCQTLGLPFVTPDCKVADADSLAAVQGAVYVKYNSSSKVCYMSQYRGIDRGVLVQLGPGRLLGHFPLGFWDEGMNNPEPQLQQQQQQ